MNLFKGDTLRRAEAEEKPIYWGAASRLELSGPARENAE